MTFKNKSLDPSSLWIYIKKKAAIKKNTYLDHI